VGEVESESVSEQKELKAALSLWPLNLSTPATEHECALGELPLDSEKTVPDPSKEHLSLVLTAKAFPLCLLFPLPEVNPDPHPHLFHSGLIQE